MSDKSVYVPVINYEDEYEILNEYPFTVRNKVNHHVISESKGDNGYMKLNLKNKLCYKHRIIALQFIPNDDPENKTQVDHINKIKDDNHIENLRWITPTQNNRNRSRINNTEYEFVDDLPDDIIKITFYKTKVNHYEFDDDQYYYDTENDEFYTRITPKLYKKLYQCIDKNNKKHIYLYDINNKKVNFYVERFKFLYDL